MNIKWKFDKDLQKPARVTPTISHPARQAILKYPAETRTYISGNISAHKPLSLIIVSQHLRELNEPEFIQGETKGLKFNYNSCSNCLYQYPEIFYNFFEKVKDAAINLKN